MSCRHLPSLVLFCSVALFFPWNGSRRLSMWILHLLQLLTCLSNTDCLKLICPEITRFEVFMLTQNLSSQFDLWCHYCFKGLGLPHSLCCLHLLTLTSNFAFVVLNFTLTVSKIGQYVAMIFALCFTL